MNATDRPLLNRVAGRVRAGLHQVRTLWFPLVQTAATAGLAWYLTHDVLSHPQPFFAPISAAVCMSASNVLRAQRAIQMMVGVALGIGIGTVVQELIGTGAIPIAVTALIALVAAVFIGQGYIGQGMMFVNQATVSAILVLALYRSGVGFERVYDALIGGTLALFVSVVLFPADPLSVLRSARVGVLDALQGVLSRTAAVAAGLREAEPDWPLGAVDRVHEQIGALIGARSTARNVVRVAPRRFGMRDSVRGADQQAVHVALLAGSVLQLARAVAPSLHDPGWLPRPVPVVLSSLASATRLAEAHPAAAAVHLAAARRNASVLHSEARGRSEVMLAGVVQMCVDDLQRVIDLRPA